MPLVPSYLDFSAPTRPRCPSVRFVSTFIQNSWRLAIPQSRRRMALSHAPAISLKIIPKFFGFAHFNFGAFFVGSAPVADPYTTCLFAFVSRRSSAALSPYTASEEEEKSSSRLVSALKPMPYAEFSLYRVRLIDRAPYNNALAGVFFLQTRRAFAYCVLSLCITRGVYCESIKLRRLGLALRQRLGRYYIGVGRCGKRSQSEKKMNAMCFCKSFISEWSMRIDFKLLGLVFNVERWF